MINFIFVLMIIILILIIVLFFKIKDIELNNNIIIKSQYRINDDIECIDKIIKSNMDNINERLSDITKYIVIINGMNNNINNKVSKLYTKLILKQSVNKKKKKEIEITNHSTGDNK